MFRALVVMAAVSAALCATPAMAWDWQTYDAGFANGTFLPYSLAPQPAGFWAGGNALVRYDASLQPAFARALSGTYLLAPTSDGGVLASNVDDTLPFFEPPPANCQLDAYGADGLPRWHRTVETALACDQVAIDGQGNAWVSAGTWNRTTQAAEHTSILHTLDAQGVDRGTRSSGAGADIFDVVVDPLQDIAYVYSTGQLTVLNAAQQTLSLPVTVEAPQGGRLAIGKDRKLAFAEVTASGSMLHGWVEDLAHGTHNDWHVAISPAAAAVAAVAPVGDGSVFVLDRRDGAAAPYTLRHIGANGQLLWSVQTDVDATECARYQGRCLLYPLIDGGVLAPMIERSYVVPDLVGTPPTADSAVVALVRYAANGDRLSDAGLAGHFLGGFITLADTSIVVAAHYSANADDGVTARNWRRLTGLGQTLPLPLPTPLPVAGVVPNRGSAVAAQVTEAGDTYLLTNAIASGNGDDVRFALSRVRADGSVAWRVSGDGQWISALSVVADDTRVCVDGQFVNGSPLAGSLRVTCFDRGNGNVLWTQPGPSNTEGAASLTRLDLRPDHGLTVLSRIDSTFGSPQQLIDYAADGTVVHDELLPNAIVGVAAAAFTLEGDVIVQQGNQLVRYTPQGAMVYSKPLLSTTSDNAAALTTLADIDVAADGSVVAVGIAQSNALTDGVVLSFGADGALRWAKRLFTAPVVAIDGWVRRAGTAVDVALYPIDSDGVSLSTFVARANLADGSVRWQRLLHGSFEHGIPTPNADTVLLAASDRQAVRLRLLSGTTGEDLSLHRENCGFVQCAFFDARVGDDGVLRAAVGGGYDGAIAPSVVALKNADVVPASVTIDQPGLGGAWWAPYENGQGFLIDEPPATHTFFMPWFTYTTAGGIDPAQLRWYTVQGDIPAAATQLELGIYENHGGAFDAPPTTTPNRVGTATLRFSDCDHGNLHYAFDATTNGGREGDITLSRLVPRDVACKLAGGATQPPTLTTTPQNGFDARMSGTWYEPDTSGQGVQFSVQPGGTLFGAWFTYDPAGASNDPTAQHWLTLQGSLAAAQNAVATVAIAQAIGGSFDGDPTGDQYAIGSAKLTATACDRMTVEYQFDDRSSAGAFRARSGTLELVKIGGCAP